MGIAIVILFICSILLFALANYKFITNTKYVNYDRIVASIKFDRPYVLSVLCLCVALPLGKIVIWYLAIPLFIVLTMFGMLYKWYILDRIVRPYRRNY